MYSLGMDLGPSINNLRDRDAEYIFIFEGLKLLRMIQRCVLSQDGGEPSDSERSAVPHRLDPRSSE